METIKLILCVLALGFFIGFFVNLIALIWEFDIYTLKMAGTTFILMIVFMGLANSALKDED